MRLSKPILLFVLGVFLGCLPAVSFAQTPPPSIMVTNNSDYLPPATPIPGSLRDAISKANNGDTVVISNTVTAPIILTGGPLAVLKSISIQGAGVGTTIIDGNSQSRVFSIRHASMVNPVTISGVTIRNGNSSLDGGAILVFLSSSLLLEDSHIGPGNKSPTASGGGIGVTNGSSLTVIHSTIDGNSSVEGGGIFCSISSITLINTTVSNNSSSRGGGILSSCTSDISNTTIFGNKAKTGGGGIENRGTLHLDHVTIANNTADQDGDNTGDGGGVGNGSGTASSMTIRDTIIADNIDGSPQGGTVDKDCSTTKGLVVTSAGHNLIGTTDQDCVINGDPTGNILNQPADLDPNGLQANGSAGPLTVALLSGSRAIDAGDPAATPTPDERGVTRPQGLGPDIGAFEFVATPNTTPTSTPTPGQNNGNSGGCALVATADFGLSGLMSLLPLAAVGFTVLRRRVK